MDSDPDYQLPADMFAGNPQYAQQYAQQLAAVQQQQAAQQQQNLYAAQLRGFWETQQQEVQQVGNDPAEFKNHQLPLARIKKIMKSDEDVRMISAEAPVLFAKACEMFILELTLRSWVHAEDNRRRTLQRSDVAAAITKNDIFDFLADIVPPVDEAKDGAADGAASDPSAAAAVPSLPAAAGTVGGGGYYGLAGSSADGGNNQAAAVGGSGILPVPGQQQQQQQHPPWAAAGAGDPGSLVMTEHQAAEGAGL